MATRWAVWFAVAGDARFLSHHDVMRVMERAAARAALPLAHSQGFNPRPRMSLPLPRPVGVASRCELLVMDLAEGADVTVLPGRLGPRLPRGMSVLREQALPAGRPPRVESSTYELSLGPQTARHVQQRLEDLQDLPRWEVERAQRPGHEDAPGVVVDLRPRVRDLACAGGLLRFTIPVLPAGSARPADVLALAGVAEACASAAASLPELLARLERVKLDSDL